MATLGLVQDIADEFSQGVEVFRRDARETLEHVTERLPRRFHEAWRCRRVSFWLWHSAESYTSYGFFFRFMAARITAGACSGRSAAGICSSSATALNAVGRRLSFSTIRTSVGVNSN